MTPEAVTAIANGLKLLAAGLAVVSNFGPGLAIGLLAYGAMIGIARNPDAAGMIQLNMILSGSRYKKSINVSWRVLLRDHHALLSPWS